LAFECTFHMFSTGTASISAEVSFCSSDIALLRSKAKTLERSRHGQHCSRQHNYRRNVRGAASDQSGGGMRRNLMARMFPPRVQKSSSECSSSSRPVLLGCPLLTRQNPSSFDWRMTVERLAFRSLVARYWSCRRPDRAIRRQVLLVVLILPPFRLRTDLDFSPLQQIIILVPWSSVSRIWRQGLSRDECALQSF